ncbi:MAG TPA: tetratricopeptide repeat protein [Pontiella sp.]
MEPGKRHHLQDIYATDHSNKDDYTPQVSSQITKERERDIRIHHFTSMALGTAIMLLLLGLAIILVRKQLSSYTTPPPPEAITQEYIPRYSLEAEAQWVLDFSHAYADPKWDGEGERPFNATWLKKAAFNVILAEKAAEVGEHGEAAEYYENALEILPNLEGVKVPLGMAYFKLEQFDKAIELLKGASDADLPYDVLNNLGAACIEGEAYADAEKYLNRSLELKPAYAEAFKNQASLYKKMENKDEAIKAYERYLDLRSEDTGIRYDFALYLTKIENWELAGEQLRILSEKITNDVSLYAVLARVEKKLGNFDASIAALQRAYQLSDPHKALLYMNDEEFDQLRSHEDFQALIKSVEKSTSR